MNERLGFKIYYHDQTIIGKTLDDWIAAPDDDVVCVVEVFNVGAGRTMKRHTIQVHSRQDYYWMAPNQLSFVYKNEDRLINQFEIGACAAVLIPQNAIVKRGVLVEDKVFERIINEASIAPPYGSFN